MTIEHKCSIDLVRSYNLSLVLVLNQLVQTGIISNESKSKSKDTKLTKYNTFKQLLRVDLTRPIPIPNDRPTEQKSHNVSFPLSFQDLKRVNASRYRSQYHESGALKLNGSKKHCKYELALLSLRNRERTSKHKQCHFNDFDAHQPTIYATNMHELISTCNKYPPQFLPSTRALFEHLPDEQITVSTFLNTPSKFKQSQNLCYLTQQLTKALPKIV